MAEVVLPGAADARRERSFVTPEGVDLRLRIASSGSRIAAYLIDLGILLGSLLLVTILAALGVLSGRAMDGMAVLWLVGLFFLRNGYFIWMEAGPRGATWGKRALRLRVVARDGGRLTTDAVIARNLLREIEWFLPLSFLARGAATGEGEAWANWAGLAWAAMFLLFPLFNRDRMRVGDLLAGTWVVEAPRGRLGAALSGGGAGGFSDAELSAYGAYELGVLEGVLRSGDAKATATVAASIRAKIGRLSDDDLRSDDRAFLQAYYDALRRKLERGLLFGRRRATKHDGPV